MGVITPRFDETRAMNRTQRAAKAAETLGILQQGSYVSRNGETHDISALLQSCVENAVHYDSSESDKWLEHDVELPVGSKQTRFTVLNKTTVEASREMCQDCGDNGKVGILSFASAKKPGGGFLTGAGAQEESLASSSGVYGSLTKFQVEYYDFHGGHGRRGFYSDNIIYSPNVPFFRNDALELVKPFTMSVITCPAVNYGILQPVQHEEATRVMKTRIQKILHAFWLNECTHLVLGAYGCGVFRNPVANIVNIFKEILCGETNGVYRGVFEHIVFAVFHPDENTFLKPFRQAFLSQQ